MADKLKMHSADIVDENIEFIASRWPNAVKEVREENGILVKKVDFDVLKQELSKELISEKQERYQMTWPGKRESIILSNSSINKVLRPNVDDSSNFSSTKNMYIEGDNLEVLKIIRETYLGKIKMIYIDPPYNTGRDSFVYNDSFCEKADTFNEKNGLYDEDGNLLYALKANNEANGRFHSNWLSMMYSRLKIAKDLLRDDGVIFISIDDNEVDNLKKICSEIFGEYNFVGCAGRITKKSNNKGDFWAPNFDYLLTYTKNRTCAKEFTGGANTEAYNLIEEEGPRKGEHYQLVRLYMSSLQNRNPEQRFWIDCPDGSKIIPPGVTFPPERPKLGDGIWRWSRSTFEANKDKIVVKEVKSSNLLNENKEPAKWNVFTKTYLNDVLNNSSAKPNSFIEGHINQIASHELSDLNIPFDYAKPTTLIKYLMEVAQIEDNDIVLDFFSGSASTAHAVMSYNVEHNKNSRYIMIQLPEPCDEKTEEYRAGFRNICEIGKERIRRAGKKIVDSSEMLTADIDIGFRDFKIDTSNMKDVYYNPKRYQQSLIMEDIDNVKEDRTALDLLFQVMLDLGIELSAKITEKTIDNKLVYFINDNYLVACFANEVNEEIIKECSKINPVYIVLRDASFANDSSNINCEQVIKTVSSSTELKVI